MARTHARCTRSCPIENRKNLKRAISYPSGTSCHISPLPNPLSTFSSAAGIFSSVNFVMLPIP